MAQGSSVKASISVNAGIPSGSSSNVSSYSSTRDQEGGIALLEGREKAMGHLPFHRKLAYGVGHVFNDMTASMWFTYLLLFYHMVVRINNTYAGLLLLIGQVVDAMATPVIGFLCDRTRIRYGRRKIWHLVGTILVAVSVFFIWHRCLFCESEEHFPLAWKIVYFSVPIAVFQVGWASTQISHLSLIPELTEDENERVGLNSIRYAFTILSNVGVFVTMFLLLEFVGSATGSHRIVPSDMWIFSGTALGIIVAGIFFATIFHIGTREPSTPAEQNAEAQEGRKIVWYKWFTMPQFYVVALIYMCTRLVVNLTQVYTPLYLVDSLQLNKASVAIGPLVIYVTQFLVTLLLKIINRIIGRYMAYFLGLAFIWGGLIWFWQQQPPSSLAGNVLIYGAAILIGVGGATLLVTSLSMVADLIGCAVGSSAFVYGLMSFTDKLCNGVAIQIIQALHPCKGSGENVCCPACSSYYRSVLVFVPGGASLMALLGLVLLSLLMYLRSKKANEKDCSPPIENAQADNGCAEKNGRLDSPISVSCESSVKYNGETKPLLKRRS